MASTEDTISIRLAGLTIHQDGSGGIDLDLRSGEIHALIGRPASGKSTLARMICGQVSTISGALVVDGTNELPLNPLKATELGLLLVKAIPDLFEDLSVAENIFFPTDSIGGFLRLGARQIRKECRELLATIAPEISPTSLVRDLKSSEKMVVAILQSLRHTPKLLVLDEALQALTPKHLLSIQKRLREYVDQGGTILWITQQLDGLHAFANRVSILAEGRIVITDQADQIDRLSLLKLSYMGWEDSSEDAGRQFYRILKYNQAILQQLPMTLIVLDENKHVRMINDSGQDFLETGTSAFQGKPVSDLLQNSAVLDLVDRCYDSPRDITGFQTGIRVGKSTRIVKIDAIPILEDDSVLGVILILEDISEAEDLRRQVILSEKLASVGLLASGVAHEINNPLEIMASSLRHLRRRVEDVALSEVIDELDDEVGHIRDIVGNLVMFSQDREREFEEFDLRELLESTLKLVRINAREKGVEVPLNLPATACLVRGSKAEIRQVVLNLLRNSFEAMPDGGTTTLNLELLDDHVQLRVLDTGPGISVQDPDEIFMPFFSTKKAASSNMGLGLSISYGIVQRHGGRITVCNHTDPVGCEFTLEFPRENSENLLSS